MTPWWIALLLVAASFLMMEFVAWFTHKYVMHGFLWVLHKDHHIRDGRKVEWNDLFALFFAIPSVVLLILGIENAMDYRTWIGVGIACYGLAYFLFHDVYVHERVKLPVRPENRYLRATLKAHLDHHKPRFFSNYGFLLAPMNYYYEEFRTRNTN
ncbi:MAG: sterol desaturase family protein [Bacteroidales bacterium]|nr:sterol desaturase family protein [Bacteroidales bacterium]